MSRGSSFDVFFVAIEIPCCVETSFVINRIIPFLHETYGENFEFILDCHLVDRQIRTTVHMNEIKDLVFKLTERLSNFYPNDLVGQPIRVRYYFSQRELMLKFLPILSDLRRDFFNFLLRIAPRKWNHLDEKEGFLSRLDQLKGINPISLTNFRIVNDRSRLIRIFGDFCFVESSSVGLTSGIFNWQDQHEKERSLSKENHPISETQKLINSLIEYTKRNLKRREPNLPSLPEKKVKRESSPDFVQIFGVKIGKQIL